MKLFKKILVANRGEIAVRVIRACRELGIKTVAIFSEVDKDSLHTKLADEALCIGPANVAQSYNNIPRIITSAEITDSEAIHPGYGFLAENHHFAEACLSSGINFIGPSPESMRLGGDKAQARQIMKRRGVPVLPGSDGPVSSVEDALKTAKRIGYPIIIKASAGGGGRGMRITHKDQDMERLFSMAQREALAAFGIGELYVEKYIPEMRHVEVQVLADSKGNTVHLGERDCSIQRRHQKLLEESPSPIVNQKLRKKIGEYAVRAAKALKYRNAGTVEFIVDPDTNIYFMEMNTRLQVEHPVTEFVTGIDIVKEQVKIAAGFPLELKQSQVRLSGHAIECRINAEDPERFIPSPGKIAFMALPGGPGVRVDTAAYIGCSISSHYDSLLAKLVVHGHDRNEAIMKMRSALDEFVIEGIKTTVAFHKWVLNDPHFTKGDVTTGFVEKSR